MEADAPNISGYWIQPDELNNAIAVLDELLANGEKNSFALLAWFDNEVKVIRQARDSLVYVHDNNFELE